MMEFKEKGKEQEKPKHGLSVKEDVLQRSDAEKFNSFMAMRYSSPGALISFINKRIGEGASLIDIKEELIEEFREELSNALSKTSLRKEDGLIARISKRFVSSAIIVALSYASSNEPIKEEFEKALNLAVESITSFVNDIVALTARFPLEHKADILFSKVKEYLMKASEKGLMSDLAEFIEEIERNEDGKQVLMDFVKNRLEVFINDVFFSQSRLAINEYFAMNYIPDSLFNVFGIWVLSLAKDIVKGKEIPDDRMIYVTGDVVPPAFKERYLYFLQDFFSLGIMNIFNFINGDYSSESIKSPFILALSDITRAYSSLPVLPLGYIVDKMGLNLEDILHSILSLNKDMKERVEKKDIPYAYAFKYLVARLARKDVPVVADVFPRNEALTKEAIERALGYRARTVQININDTMPFFYNRTLAQLFGPIFTLVEISPFKEALGSTDGGKIYIRPFVSFFNTSELNTALMFGVMAHEVNHIRFGSFVYDVSEDMRIDAVSKAIKIGIDKGKVKELKDIQNFINGVLYDFHHEMKRKLRFRKSSKVTLVEVYETFRQAVEKNAKKNKKYADILLQGLGAGYSGPIDFIFNAFEDWKIDKFYEESRIRDKLVGAGLFEREQLKLRAIYKTMKHALLWVSANSYIESMKKELEKKEVSKEEEDKWVKAVNFALFFTKLDELFFDTFDAEEAEPYVEFMKMAEKEFIDIEGIRERGYPDPDKEDFNGSFKAMLEYLAFLIALHPPKIKLKRIPNQGGSQSGQSKGAESGGKAGEKKKGGKGKEGRKEGQDKSEAGEKKGEDQKEGKKKSGGDEGRISPIEPDEGIERQKADEDHGKALIKKKDKKRSRHEIGEKGTIKINEKQRGLAITVSSSLVEKYKAVFRQMKTGELKAIDVESKFHGNVNLSKLLGFMSGESGDEKFFQYKAISQRRKGSSLKQREIIMYLTIDESSSMSGERFETALNHTMAMFVAYREVIKEAGPLNVKLRLALVSDEGNLREFPAEDIEYVSQGNAYVVYGGVEQAGGGTDIAGMFNAVSKRLKTIMDETMEKALKDPEGIYLNPSVLVVFFTDYGDNFGNVEGVKDAIREFRENAKRYVEDSKTVNIEAPDAGVGIVFVGVGVDEEGVMEGVRELVPQTLPEPEGTFTVESDEGKEVRRRGIEEALASLLPVLNGKKATNIKEG